MFEYERVGKLAGTEQVHDLLLPQGRPLSYLRARKGPEESWGLTQALLERRATELRVRIPIVAERGDAVAIAAAMRRFAVSQVFPVLEGTCEREGEVDLCWLDLVQAAALGGHTGGGFAPRETAVEAAGISFFPTYEASPGGGRAESSWQYWNSDWEFLEQPEGREGWWRVRPNATRQRSHWLLLDGRGPEARGTLAACLHPQTKRELGNPSYVVIKHPYREGYVPVHVLEDRDLVELPNGKWEQTLFLDRTARDSLGLLDGELCVVHPWLHPRSQLFYRRLRERVVGSRTIAAHARAPARADLDKPVCRLEPEALETIGGRGGDFVQIERVVRADDGMDSRWKTARTSQRVLPIDAAERERRSRWEAPQLWDERAAGPNEGDGAAPELEGYVNCAERLGLYPPYPAIYLNYYTRKEALDDLGLCQPVQVRVGIAKRMAGEASEFAWLAVIALLGAAIAFLDSSVRIAAVVALVLLTALMLVFRPIRAVR